MKKQIPGALFLLASILMALPAIGQGGPPIVVRSGADLFKSPAALETVYDLAACLLPPVYFEVGTPALTGCQLPLVPQDPNDPNSPLSFPLRLQGVPIGTYEHWEVGSVDTIVRRLQDLDFGQAPTGDVLATTPIELVALKLISADPFEVTCDQGKVRWIAEVEVDAATGPSLGNMEVTLDHPDLLGGTARSTLSICPRVRFTRIDPGSTGSFEVLPCDMLCGPVLVGETTWAFNSPNPQAALKVPGLTTDNFNFTEVLTPLEQAAVQAEVQKKAAAGSCNPDCPCIFKYPHLAPDHRHQACLPCPCDADSALPTVDPPEPKTVECTQRGGTSRFATCIPPDADAGTLCIEDWLDDVTCTDLPIDEPDKITTCRASGPPSVFPAGCGAGHETKVDFLAIDSCCNENIVKSSLFVRDTLPPVITGGSSDLYCVWPPSHNFICFNRSQFAPQIADICHDFNWKFAGCSASDDGQGTGNTDPDCMITNQGESLCVRAERNPQSANGRRYEVQVAATDECGNLSTTVNIGFIHIPKNQTDGCLEPPDLRVACSPNPSSGRVPLAVQFTDQTTTQGGAVITAWRWDFADGGSSTLQNPAHTYNASGNYPATLTVFATTRDGQTISSAATCPVDVAPPLSVSCEATPTSGNAPLAVSFTGTANEAGVSWSWSFGDGGTSATGPATSHTYNSAGNFAATVTVTAADGATASASCPQIVVQTPPPPPDLDCVFDAPASLGVGGGNQLEIVPIVVIDSNGNAATITVTSIRQDEVLDATGGGDGNTCPDGRISTTTTPDDTAEVMDQRAGSGDGRVYHITFTAVGTDGATCGPGGGVLKVCVPKGAPTEDCVDGGPLYDSLGPC